MCFELRWLGYTRVRQLDSRRFFPLLLSVEYLRTLFNAPEGKKNTLKNCLWKFEEFYLFIIIFLIMYV